MSNTFETQIETKSKPSNYGIMRSHSAEKDKIFTGI